MDSGPKFEDLAKKLEEARAEMDAVKRRIAELTVETAAGDGAVRIKMSGDYRLLEVKLDPGAVEAGGLESLEPLVVQAVNDAMRAAAEMAERNIGELAGGLGLGTPPAPLS